MYHLNGKVVARFWFDGDIIQIYEGDNSYFAKRPQDFGYTADEVIKRYVYHEMSLRHTVKAKTFMRGTSRN